jgi:hypothetical protein
MLGNEELSAWFQRVRLPECGRSIIHQVRSSEARRVGGGHPNVSGRYPSKKMGVTIQFESHRVELARIYELEHDPAVLEYWDQPPPSSCTTGVHRESARWLSTPPTTL